MTILRRYLVPLIVVVALVAADAAARYLRRPDPGAPTFLSEPFRLAPFPAVDIDGRDVSLEAWRGKVAIVNFWATWCLPCRKEIPALVSLQERYADDLVVIGVLDDQAPTDFVRTFGASLGMNYPIVRTTSEIELSFSPVMVLPTTYVVDAAGQVVSIHGGEIDPVLLEQQVQALVPRVPLVPLVPTAIPTIPPVVP